MPSITPRDRVSENARGSQENAARHARYLLRTSRLGFLSTLDPNGQYPYGTITNLATQLDGTPFFYAAGLALHTRNIKLNPRICLTVSALKAGDALVEPRLSLVGNVEEISGSEIDIARRRYIGRFPKAKTYTYLRDAFFFRLKIDNFQFSAGPGMNINEFNCEELLIDIKEDHFLLNTEAAEVERINKIPEAANRIALAAGADEMKKNWKISGIDPEGVDLGPVDKVL